MNNALRKRMGAMEARVRVGEILPRLFVTIYDFSDESVIGFTTGPDSASKIVRQAGESLEALKERATLLAPDQIVFLACYSGRDNGRFDSASDLQQRFASADAQSVR